MNSTVVTELNKSYQRHTYTMLLIAQHNKCIRFLRTDLTLYHSKKIAMIIIFFSECKRRYIFINKIS